MAPENDVESNKKENGLDALEIQEKNATLFVDDEYYKQLHAVRAKMPDTVSDEQAMMNLIKAVVGTGILSLPQAFHNSGLWFGLFLVCFTNFVNVACLRKLVYSAQVLSRRAGRAKIDYGELGELACFYGPNWIKNYGGVFREVINISLYALQYGSCAVYFIFIAENIRQVADPEGTLPLTAYVAMLLPIEIALCSIRQLKWIAIPSTGANGLYIIAFISIFYYVFSDFPSWERLPAVQSVALWPLAFGSIMFAFCSAGVIVPIENRCRTPGHLLKWNGVLNISYVIITIISAAVGFYGYIKYGYEIQGSITLNLPQSDPLAQAVKIMAAVTIILSFPVQFYSPTEVICQIINRRVKSPKKALIVEYAVRYLLVLITFALAVLIPRLGLFISLVGALTASILAFFFPPIIDILIQYRGHKSPAWLYINNLLAFLFGILGLRHNCPDNEEATAMPRSELLVRITSINRNWRPMKMAVSRERSVGSTPLPAQFEYLMRLITVAAAGTAARFAKRHFHMCCPLGIFGATIAVLRRKSFRPWNATERFLELHACYAIAPLAKKLGVHLRRKFGCFQRTSDVCNRDSVFINGNWR
uniref:Aa_trans domain-containing protein n=1 Tax=Trichuris muris TaxID=70415 RepID=A0A5S6R2A1_TRIMR